MCWALQQRGGQGARQCRLRRGRPLHGRTLDSREGPHGPCRPYPRYPLHPTLYTLLTHQHQDRVLLSLLPSFPNARTWPAVSPPLSLSRSLSLALSRSLSGPPTALRPFCDACLASTNKLNLNLKLIPKYAGLNDAFNKDTFKDKMNLGVGAYRDDNGKVVVYIL
jgi:hypothetical protein